jgi:hypothetical protein
LRRFGLLVFVGLLAASPRPALSDLVTTSDGTVYEGKVVEDRPDAVVIDTTFDGRKEVPREQVKKVDTSVPPLRDQLAYRVREAKEAKALLEAADWAKSKGFKDEVVELHRKVIELDPQNARARKALGHVKVGPKWMSPEEKEAADAAAVEAEMKAKGLVLHDGRWVTPQEKEALEKGLVKDGDEWVTEEAYHTRRGEKKVDGKWIRVGEEEGKARATAISQAIGTPLTALWGPHVDLIHELKPADAQALLDAAEKGFRAAASLLDPAGSEALSGLRVQVVVFDKATPYARFVERFAEEQQIGKIPGQEGWARASARQKSFWWTDPVAVTGHYVFPNTVRSVTSNVVHNLALIALNRHRFNYRWNSSWLQEGFAYRTEMASIGYSDSYTIGSGGADPGEASAWTDSKKWKDSLRGAVAVGKDPSMPRLAGATLDRLGLVELVKCWSVVDLLAGLDPAKFKAFVDGTKVRNASEEEALQAAYGLDYRGLEARWRAFVQAGFKP